MNQFDYPKSARLLRQRQFQALSQKAFCFKGKVVTIFWKKSNLPHIRLGITVTKKYGNAVQRNRFKRLVREVFRLLRKSVNCGVDCNVRPRTNSETPILFSDLFEDLKHFIEQTTFS